MDSALIIFLGIIFSRAPRTHDPTFKFGFNSSSYNACFAIEANGQMIEKEVKLTALA